ncbi:MAG: hypothetical protein PHV17_03560 [Candidatus Omnitrophica bacterium]|nr:hypothetical protein [Candidatus Omnitrophota bacterium]
MHIKLILHGLAIFFGIIAGASALLSSQNKIPLFICFSLIAAVFELTIPFLQINKIVSPQINYSLQRVLSNYAPGIVVNGVIWQNDFEEYLFRIQNEHAKVEIYDLRIDMDVLGGIVTQSIFSQEGCENINFSSQPFLSSGIGNRKNITKTFKTYSNNLKINIAKLFPEGRCELKLLIKTLPRMAQDESGFFGVDYRYFDQDGHIEKKSLRHKILLKNGKLMFIDISSIIEGTHKRSISMIPERPLIFKKDGRVVIKENNLTNQSSEPGPPLD